MGKAIVRRHALSENLVFATVVVRSMRMCRSDHGNSIARVAQLCGRRWSGTWEFSSRGHALRPAPKDRPMTGAAQVASAVGGVRDRGPLRSAAYFAWQNTKERPETIWFLAAPSYSARRSRRPTEAVRDLARRRLPTPPVQRRSLACLSALGAAHVHEMKIPTSRTNVAHITALRVRCYSHGHFCTSAWTSPPRWQRRGSRSAHGGARSPCPSVSGRTSTRSNAPVFWRECVPRQEVDG